MRALAATAILTSGLAVAGCGGKSAKPVKSLAQVKACFERLGTRVEPFGIPDLRREHLVVTRVGGGDFQSPLDGKGSSGELGVFVYKNTAQARFGGRRSTELINQYAKPDQSGTVLASHNVVAVSFEAVPAAVESRFKRCSS